MKEGINIILYVLGVIATIAIVAALSLWVFLATPVVSRLGLVGEGGVYTSETVMANILPEVTNVSTDDMLSQYYLTSGHTNLLTEGTLIRALKRIDSLHNEIVLWQAYSQNIMDVINKRKRAVTADSVMFLGRELGEVNESMKLLDSVYRANSLAPLGQMTRGRGVSDKLPLYSPLRGNIISSFSYVDKRYEVKIEVLLKSSVMSVAKGTVVSSVMTTAGQYAITIQHENNLVSVYRGITITSLRAGDRVASRDVVGYLGGVSGPDGVGPYRGVLEFELWDSGNPVNPEHYIVFN